jgi:hypothetical protein
VVFRRFVADGVLRIEAGALNEGKLDAMARSLGVSMPRARRGRARSTDSNSPPSRSAAPRRSEGSFR